MRQLRQRKQGVHVHYEAHHQRDAVRSVETNEWNKRVSFSFSVAAGCCKASRISKHPGSWPRIRRESWRHVGHRSISQSAAEDHDQLDASSLLRIAPQFLVINLIASLAPVARQLIFNQFLPGKATPRLLSRPVTRVPTRRHYAN